MAARTQAATMRQDGISPDEETSSTSTVPSGRTQNPQPLLPPPSEKKQHRRPVLAWVSMSCRKNLRAVALLMLAAFVIVLSPLCPRVSP